MFYPRIRKSHTLHLVHVMMCVLLLIRGYFVEWDNRKLPCDGTEQSAPWVRACEYKADLRIAQWKKNVHEELLRFCQCLFLFLLPMSLLIRICCLCPWAITPRERSREWSRERSDLHNALHFANISFHRQSALVADVLGRRLCLVGKWTL